MCNQKLIDGQKYQVTWWNNYIDWKADKTHTDIMTYYETTNVFVNFAYCINAGRAMSAVPI